MPLSLGAAGPALVLAAALAAAGPAAAQDRPPGPVTRAEVAEAARQIQSELPIQVDEITRAVGIRAEGTEFVYDMAINEAIPAEAIEEARRVMQAENQRRLCDRSNIAGFIRRGGSMRHIYTEQDGRRFETRVTACP